MCVCMQGYRSLMGINVAQSCEAALSYYHKAAKKGMIGNYIDFVLTLNDCLCLCMHAVVDEVTLITGGLLISKVRLMEEDNEVGVHSKC